MSHHRKEKEHEGRERARKIDEGSPSQAPVLRPDGMRFALGFHAFPARGVVVDFPSSDFSPKQKQTEDRQHPAATNREDRRNRFRMVAPERYCENRNQENSQQAAPSSLARSRNLRIGRINRVRIAFPWL